MPSPDDVRAACETAAATMRTDSDHSEIAFFGGSFTAIPREIMVSLLGAAAPYIKRGFFRGIRISTRPDAVDEAVLTLLKEYHVTAVELGAQSMDDGVLAANFRGHTSADVTHAAGLIKSSGLELGLQMMTGLYQSNNGTDYETARRLADLRPVTMRIYPTLVMEHTALAKLYRMGAYTPQTLEQAVALCAGLLRFFERENGIRVIRLGLHAGSEMQAGLVAGPWHPAFRELCEGVLFYETALDLLKMELPEGGRAALGVNPKAVSRMTGQKRCNLIKLAQAGYDVTVRADPAVADGDIILFSRLMGEQYLKNKGRV